MRFFLFRGKRTDNSEWVYGSLMVQDDDCFIFTNNGFCIKSTDDNLLNPDFVRFYGRRVIPETVGQFTGMYDKNGTRIFEGDIVKTSFDIVLIKWAMRGFYPYRNKNGKFTKVTNWDCVMRGEVIGNIHDNPEMVSL